MLLAWLHLFLHVPGIDFTDLPLDDAGTWGVAHRPLRELLTLPTEFHSQPPLYYWLLRAVMTFGSAAWYLRGFSWLWCLAFLLYVLLAFDELSLLARAALCFVFLRAELTNYLSTAVRPYAMAACLTLVSLVQLGRLIASPSRRRAIGYAAVTLAMLYTMAFEIAVLLVQGLVVVAILAVELVRSGWGTTWPRRRTLVLAMAAVCVGYVPYLAMAVHYQLRANAVDNLPKVKALATYEGVIAEQLRFAPAVVTLLLVLAAIGIVAELRQRRPAVLAWALTVPGSIAFVWYFISGRSPIGPQPKYATPALVSLCVLAAMGVHHLTVRYARVAWGVLVAYLALTSWASYQTFHAWAAAPRVVGPFEQMHREVAVQPGRKVVFFDVGYDGQHFEYVIRHDPTVTTATRRGPGWASGGDLLTDDYVRDTIAATEATTRCFYYHVERADGPYARVFVPEMQRRGYVPAPPVTPVYRRNVVGFCRP